MASSMPTDPEWNVIMQGTMQNWPLVIPSIIDHAAREHGQRELVTRSVEGPIRRTNLKAIHSRARRVAKALTMEGVEIGDRIATMAWNTDRHIELWYGITGCGAVYHTLNPRLFREQLEYIINHAEDKLLFVDLSFLPVIEELGGVLPTVRKIIVLTDSGHLPDTDLPVEAYEEWVSQCDDEFSWVDLEENMAAGLCYTSGTTGEPKGVLYSHRSNVIHSLVVNQADAFAIRAMDSVLPIVPMFHANAWALAFSCVATGAKLVLPGADMTGAGIVELLNKEEVSFSAGVPTIWSMVLQHLELTGGCLPYLNRIVIGGSACPQHMLEKFENDYDVEVLHAWGMTEMSPLGTIYTDKPAMKSLTEQQRSEQKLKQGSPPYTVEMKIVDDEQNELPRDGIAFGRLLVRGPCVARHYFKREECANLTADGWFDTGDIATIDKHGVMQITDREKDLIKSGGEWISSIEIENAVTGHPDIAEAAVIGVSHPKWSERPVLIVVARNGKVITLEEARQFLKNKIAGWWMPDGLVQVDKIPHTATGKINKLQLRKEFSDYKLGALSD